MRYLKKLNRALERMVLDVARDKNKARKKLNELTAEFKGAEALVEVTHLILRFVKVIVS